MARVRTLNYSKDKHNKLTMPMATRFKAGNEDSRLAYSFIIRNDIANGASVDSERMKMHECADSRMLYKLVVTPSCQLSL